MNLEFAPLMNDILTRNDIQLLIDRFYTKVRADALLAPVFAHVDWEHHTPIIINFWSSLLLGDESYQGNPFQKHIGLAINPTHFQQWLKLFHETIDENFSGEKALEAKDRANSIAKMFQFKLGLSGN
jgi:hemoglobin